MEDHIRIAKRHVSYLMTKNIIEGRSMLRHRLFLFGEYLHPCFKGYFDMRSGMATNGLYPTVTIRQIMWALKMKPIKKERWETVFDRRDI